MLVPLHERSMHAVSVHVIALPVHVPPPHASLYVHRFESSHDVPVRHCHVPEVFVQ